MPPFWTLFSRDQRLMLISTLLWGFGQSLFWYIQPLYVAYLGATPAQIGFVLGGAGLAVAFLYIPMGLWADRRGRKPIIVAGWLLGTGAALAMALAPDWLWFLPALAAYQFSNFAMPAFFAYGAANSNGRTDQLLASLAGAAALGSIISPAIGGWIGQEFGLRAIYLVAATTFACSSAVILQLDGRASLIVARESARKLIVNRQFLWQIGFALLTFFALALGQVMLPNYLKEVRHLTVGQIGTFGTVGTAGIVVLTFLIGRLPTNRRTSLMLCQFLALIAAVIWLSSESVLLIGLAYFIHGSHRLLRPVILGRLARSLTPGLMSFGYGFQETALWIGLALAPPVAGLLYTYDPTYPLIAGIAGLCLTSLLSLLLPSSGGLTINGQRQLAASRMSTGNNQPPESHINSEANVLTDDD
jgi:MFS transporter, DHA1 family, multidrug resistance protein